MLKRAKSFLLENKTAKQTVAKNTFWVFFGQIAARLIRVVLIIYAARLLGATNYGAFSYALSLAAFFTIFADFGINALITRESSKDITVQKKYFTTGLVIKMVMIVFIALFVIVCSPLLFKQALVMELMPLVILIVSFDSLRDFASSLSRAWEKMEIEAFIQIITNLFIVAVGFVALYISPTARALSWGYVVGTGIGMLYAFYQFRHYLKDTLRTFSKNLIKPILISSWPLGILALSGVIMLNTDTVMIGWFRSLADVGYYSAAQRVSQLIFLVPGMMMTALFPSMAKASDREGRINLIIEKSSVLLLILAIPLTVGGVILAPQIINLLFGAGYMSGVSSFKIMSLMYVPVFLSTVFGNALFAINREKVLLRYSVLSMLGNFAFNLFFIPIWGIAGSALSSLINQTAITSLVYRELKKNLELHILNKLRRILAATTLMGVAIFGLLLVGANIYAIITISAVTYLGALIALKEPILTDVRGMLKI